MESWHPTLSVHILEYINNLDEDDDDLQPDERAEFEENRNVINAIVDDPIASRETLTDNKLASVEKLVESSPEMIEDFLDERFTRKLVEGVP